MSVHVPPYSLFATLNKNIVCPLVSSSTAALVQVLVCPVSTNITSSSTLNNGGLVLPSKIFYIFIENYS